MAAGGSFPKLSVYSGVLPATRPDRRDRPDWGKKSESGRQRREVPRVRDGDSASFSSLAPLLPADWDRREERTGVAQAAASPVDSRTKPRGTGPQPDYKTKRRGGLRPRRPPSPDWPPCGGCCLGPCWLCIGSPEPEPKVWRGDAIWGRGGGARGRGSRGFPDTGLSLGGAPSGAFQHLSPEFGAGGASLWVGQALRDLWLLNWGRGGRW